MDLSFFGKSLRSINYSCNAIVEVFGSHLGNNLLWEINSITFVPTNL